MGEVIRFETEDEAIKWENGGKNNQGHLDPFFTLQDGTKLLAGPMITGLRKADAILLEPFASYYSCLYNSLLKSRVWVIIGYGGVDPHINSCLSRALNARVKRPTHLVTVDLHNQESEPEKENLYMASFLSKFMWPNWEQRIKYRNQPIVGMESLESDFRSCWIREQVPMLSYFNGTEDFCKKWGSRVVEIALNK